MRTLAVVLGFLMVTTALVLSNCTAEALVSPIVPMPVAAAPAGVEILMCVR